jgi:hypothetical protein
MNHQHTECYQKTFTSEGLTRLKDEVSLQENHDKAYFLTAFKRLLQNRGHKITEDTANIVKLPREAMIESDASLIASFGHASQEVPIVDDRTYIQNHRFKCQALFSYSYEQNRTITNEMALAYCKDRWTLERYQKLTSTEPEGDLCVAQEVFTLLLKERLVDDDCEHILKAVKKHQHALARLDFLPARWVGRGIPRNNTRENVSELAEHWGLITKIKPYQQTYTISVSISPLAAMISPLRIETKADKKAQALELLEQGHSKAEVAKAVGASKDTVKRWSRVKGVQKDAVATNSINTLIVGDASKCTHTGGQELGIGYEYNQTPSVYTDSLSFEGGAMPEHEAMEIKSTDTFCPIREIERQKDLELLPEDAELIAKTLKSEPIRVKRDITLGYIEAWRVAKLAEPLPHCQQNAGRKAANVWLRERTRHVEQWL